MADVLISVSTEGAVVAEVDLSGGDVTVEQLLEEARSHRAEVVWAHGGDLGSAGFTRRPGYVRLHADQPEPGDMTEVIDVGERPGLLTAESPSDCGSGASWSGCVRSGPAIESSTVRACSGPYVPGAEGAVAESCLCAAGATVRSISTHGARTRRR